MLRSGSEAAYASTEYDGELWCRSFQVSDIHPPLSHLHFTLTFVWCLYCARKGHLEVSFLHLIYSVGRDLMWLGRWTSGLLVSQAAPNGMYCE